MFEKKINSILYRCHHPLHLHTMACGTFLYDSFGAFQVRVPKNEKKNPNNMHINCLLHVNVV